MRLLILVGIALSLTHFAFAHGHEGGSHHAGREAAKSHETKLKAIAKPKTVK